MHPHIRTIALALLIGALLSPPPVAAARTCLAAPAPSGTIGDIRTVISGNATYASANAGLHDQVLAQVQLQVTIAPDGAARAEGEIHLRAESDGAAATSALAPYAPMLVIAKRVVGADCADVDGDGTAGLVRLEMASRGGDAVPIVLIATESDMDGNETYPIELRIGTESGMGQARAKLSREWFHSGKAK